MFTQYITWYTSVRVPLTRQTLAERRSQLVCSSDFQVVSRLECSQQVIKATRDKQNARMRGSRPPAGS